MHAKRVGDCGNGAIRSGCVWLLRRRLLYVQQRTAHILSLQSMSRQSLSTTISTREIKKLKPKEAHTL